MMGGKYWVRPTLWDAAARAAAMTEGGDSFKGVHRARP
jgi:hypothetical protein